MDKAGGEVLQVMRRCRLVFSFIFRYKKMICDDNGDSHQDITFITEHLFNLLDSSLPPLVSQDDPLPLLLPHLVYLPPHQPHHGNQVHTDQGLKYHEIV